MAQLLGGAPGGVEVPRPSRLFEVRGELAAGRGSDGRDGSLQTVRRLPQRFRILPIA